METIIDEYKEHSLHLPPYWRNMKTCSECYKEHNTIMRKINYKGRGLGYIKGFDNLVETGRQDNFPAGYSLI